MNSTKRAELHFAFACMVVLLLVGSAPSQEPDQAEATPPSAATESQAGQEGAILAWRYKVGEVFSYLHVEEQYLPDESTRLTKCESFYMTQSVREIRADGEIAIDLVISRYVEEDEDSLFDTDDERCKSIEHPIWGALGHPLQLLLKADGQLEVSGSESIELPEFEFPGGEEIENERFKEAMRKMMRGLLKSKLKSMVSPAALAKRCPQYLARLPANASEGATWTVDRGVRNVAGSHSAIFTVTPPASEGETRAKVEVTITKKKKKKNEPTETRSAGTGEMVFDTNAGKLASLELRVEEQSLLGLAISRASWYRLP